MALGVTPAVLVAPAADEIPLRATTITVKDIVRDLTRWQPTTARDTP